jgi:hypothetical protein
VACPFTEACKRCVPESPDFPVLNRTYPEMGLLAVCT